MAYGFNEDKSKSDIQALLGQKFVVLQGSYAMGGYTNMARYIATSEQLAALGISDVTQYVCIGKSFLHGGAWIDEYIGNEFDASAPPAMRVQLQSANRVNLNMHVPANYINSTIQYRVVLMRIS